MNEAWKELKVVYVEDEEEVRSQIARALRRRVAEIHTAENGKEGLELVQKVNPDVVVTDLEMPVMNGLEMIQHIRDEFDRERPIIVVTAYKDDEHHTDLADGYVYKPVVIDELAEQVLNLALAYKQAQGR